ncbi:hypothetical protein CCACVL1_03187, partial [Corchorus capsularis]
GTSYKLQLVQLSKEPGKERIIFEKVRL